MKRALLVAGISPAPLIPAGRVVFANEATAPPLPMFTVVVPEGQDRRARAITMLLEDRHGTLWVGTSGGLSRLEQTDGRLALRAVEIVIPNEYPEQRLIFDLLEDRRGSLWIATPNGLYPRWLDGSTARYTQRDGLLGKFLHCLLEDHEGRLWYGTREAGFFRIIADYTHRPPVVVRPYASLDGVSPWVFRLFEASDRRFWIGTDGGLAEFLPDREEHGVRFHTYTTRNGLNYHDVSSISQDLAGNLWLGTLGGGAARLARESERRGGPWAALSWGFNPRPRARGQ
jgi:ligand-binding sensor domain-containing protein